MPRTLAVPPPDDGRPWGLNLGGGWLLRSGSGLIMYDLYIQREPWRHPSATTAVVPTSDRLVYAYDDQLVAMGPDVRGLPTPG